MEVDARLTKGLVVDDVDSRVSKGKVYTVSFFVGIVKDFGSLIRRITPYRRNLR